MVTKFTQPNKKKQLRKLLLNEKGTIPIEIALGKAKKRWQKN